MKLKLKDMFRNSVAILLWLCCIYIPSSHQVEISVSLEDLKTLSGANVRFNPLNGQHLMVLSFEVSIDRGR